MVRKVIYDFETTNKKPRLANPLQFAFCFVDTVTGLKKAFSYYIKFEKLWCSCTEDEKDALEFNGISDNVENSDMKVSTRRELFRKYKQDGSMQEAKKYYVSLNEHNQVSKSSVQVIKLFLKHLSEYLPKFDILEGYNIISFDNVILDNWFLENYKKKFSDLFVYEINDVLNEIRKMSDGAMFELPDKTRVFTKNYLNGTGAFQTFLQKEGESMQEVKHFLKLENITKTIYG